jgi:hypothetical protein
VRDRADGDPRLALRRPEHAADVERLALHPRGESRRGEQVVEAHRQLEARLGGEEGLEVEDADARDGRCLDRLDE